MKQKCSKFYKEEPHKFTSLWFC